jgi:HEAT repeat protein
MDERAELEREVEALIAYADGVPRDDDTLFDRAETLVGRNPGMALEIGRAIISSANPDRRETATNLIGVAALIDPALRAAALHLLRPALDDLRVGPLSAAIIALGSLADAHSRDGILAKAGHADSLVRHAVAVSLPSVGLNEPALAALRELTLDDDDDVRNVAAFGLAMLSNADDKATRDALLDLADDDVYEIRVEAIFGLSRWQDERVRPYLMDELSDPDHADELDQALAFLDRGTGRDWLAAAPPEIGDESS